RRARAAGRAGRARGRGPEALDPLRAGPRPPPRGAARGGDPPAHEVDRVRPGLVGGPAGLAGPRDGPPPARPCPGGVALARPGRRRIAGPPPGAVERLRQTGPHQSERAGRRPLSRGRARGGRRLARPTFGSTPRRSHSPTTASSWRWRTSASATRGRPRTTST